MKMWDHYYELFQSNWKWVRKSSSCSHKSNYINHVCYIRSQFITPQFTHIRLLWIDKSDVWCSFKTNDDIYYNKYMYIWVSYTFCVVTFKIMIFFWNIYTNPIDFLLSRKMIDRFQHVTKSNHLTMSTKWHEK